ncbi:MAG TPA: DUF2231 domain-containing protein, partial [bacterium]|nr:DUF2231 domain-containing protein [bacterium]
MTPIEPTQAAGWLAGAQQFVSAAKLHPILVNFTAALVPFSVAADAAARWRKDETLRHAAWWALLAAALIT